MLEVLVANIAFGLSRGSICAYKARLASAGSYLGCGSWCVQALLEVSLGACQRRLDQFFAAVLQRDVQTAQCRPCRDVAAHDTGTDDMHVPKINLRLAAAPPESLLQQKHP